MPKDSSSLKPVFCNAESGYLALTFCAPDRVQCCNCPAKVLEVIYKCITTVRQAVAGDSDAATKEIGQLVATTKVHSTVTEFALGGFPFMTEPTIEGKNMGSIFAMNVLEELALMKYDLVTTTNLTSGLGISATWFFIETVQHWKVYTRIPTLNTRPTTVIIEPSGCDVLRIIRSSPDIVQAMKAAIQKAWKYGCDRGTESTYGDTRIYSIQLANFPWYTHREQKDPAVAESKQLLLEIVGQMTQLQYTLVCSTNIYGQTDSLVFMHHPDMPQYTPDNYCMVSLDTSNCVRLINCAEAQVEAMRDIVQSTGKRILEYPGRSNSGTHYEFAIDDRPWIDIPMKSTASARDLVKEIIQMMANYGCHLVEALDVSRHVFDRSVLLFHHESAEIMHLPDDLECCTIALAYHNTLSLIGLPRGVTKTVTEKVTDLYQPGVTHQDNAGPSNLVNIVLEGFPWTAMGEYDRLHGTAALLVSIESMQKEGWEVLASIDIAGRTNPEVNENGPHSLFFAKTG